MFEDEDRGFFLIEKFPQPRFALREKVARILVYLNDQGLDQALCPEKRLIQPQGPGSLKQDSGLLAFFHNHWFQVTRFLDSTDLQRPQWLSSAQMGEEMAGFLIHMHQAGQGIDQAMSFSPFSIKAYIYKLFGQMRSRHPHQYERYSPILSYLETGFMDAHDDLPLGFCHGDFHPLNVIWDNCRVKAVIDWEFAGIKPQCYDAANLVGCAGIEHPEGLAQPMVTRFLAQLKTENIIHEPCWKWFGEYVLALRFAWLSEWLRKEDEHMLDLELAFMQILVRHMDELKEIWALP